MHTTNYFNTLIEIAEDCPLNYGEVPPQKSDKKSVANYQFEMLSKSPYTYTSDEVLFTVFATRKAIDKNEWEAEKTLYFSKGQPCFRASPLPKRYGWGIHSNEIGKIAMLSSDSKEYKALQADPNIKKVKAMKSKK
ncbi:MAG: DUF6157 family protein [Flavobacteriales bacterium]|nr:DUF6157 family protein [Flavobacteriales bacterium]